MKNELTEKQTQIYAFVAGYIDDNGFCPTNQEVAERVGICSSAVEAHLKNIASKGWLIYNGKKFRKFQLV